LILEKAAEWGQPGAGVRESLAVMAIRAAMDVRGARSPAIGPRLVRRHGALVPVPIAVILFSLAGK
jgi:hypothetical protein